MAICPGKPDTAFLCCVSVVPTLAQPSLTALVAPTDIYSRFFLQVDTPHCQCVTRERQHVVVVVTVVTAPADSWTVMTGGMTEL